jgi:peptidyl-prolyl cis-trans isomerase SurA
MKKKLIILFLFFLTLNPKTSIAKIESKIILKVENEIITSYEVKNKILISLILAGNEINQENINKLKKQALDSLIQIKLKKIELLKYNLKKNDKQINEYLNSISSNDVLGFKNKLKINNLDYELFLKEVEIQHKWQELIYKIYSNKIEIDETSIDKQLSDLIKKKSDIKEFRISEIEILLNENDSEEKIISNIQNQIREEGFEITALKYSVSSSSSNKGDLGWINAKSLSNEIYNILNKLKPGEITDPIKKQNTILFFKINETRISKTKNIDIIKLKKKLISNKKNELFNLYSRSHLSKLKNTSLIEYK